MTLVVFLVALVGGILVGLLCADVQRRMYDAVPERIQFADPFAEFVFWCRFLFDDGGAVFCTDW